MITATEFREALEAIEAMRAEGRPTWGEWMEKTIGIDPNVVLHESDTHAVSLAHAGVIPPLDAALETHAISWGSGFTLALMLMHLREERNKD